MPSPEWLIEHGIGEVRSVLVADGRIVEARIQREGVVPAGTVLTAQLRSAGRNAVAIADGQEYLLPRGAPGVTEGARFSLEVSREALGGAEPWKRPLARMAEGKPRPPAEQEGRSLRFPAPMDELEAAGWSELLDEARSGLISFPGGELRVSVTPAMTLIDVDGRLSPAELAIAGARAAAAAIRRHAIGGSIGIDLPTVDNRSIRTAAAAEIDAALPRPFERTAVNGFGFLQIVRPRTRASLFELATDRAEFEARALLRRAAKNLGATTLVAYPAIISVLQAQPGWIDALTRQVGGAVTLRGDPSIAMSAGDVQGS
jgi:hypothetical protein